MKTQVNREYRCSCGKLLFKGMLVSSNLEIKCLRCGNILTISDQNNSQNPEKSYSLIFNADGNILNASPSVEKILGYKPNEMVGMNMYKVNPTTAKGYFRQILTNAVGSNEPFRFETIHKNKAGRKIKINASVKISHGKPEDLFLGFYTKKPLSARSPKGLMVDATTPFCDIMTEFDLNFTCTYVDAEVVKYTGFEATEYVGRSVFEFMPKKLRVIARMITKYSFSREAPFQYAHNQALCKDGSIVQFKSYFLPKYNDKGIFCGYATMNWLKKTREK